MVVFAWLVLGLVFADELLACVAAGVVGWALPAPWLLVWLLPALVVAVWACFASPRAPYGGPVVRPVVKALVFGSASLGLWLVGHRVGGASLLAFSVVVNGLAQLRVVRAVAAGEPT